MHRALSSRWLRGALSIGDRAALAEVPVYLCPRFSAAGTRHTFAPPARAPRKLLYGQRRCVHVTAEPASAPPDESRKELEKRLPLVCSGCGALSQTVEAGQAGYFNLSRKSVQQYVSPRKERVEEESRKEDVVVEEALQNLGEEKLKELGLDPRLFSSGKELETDRPTKGPSPQREPLCDRCHELLHHHAGEPIYHPAVDSLRETIEESPFKHNHIYHVIDAADFPMSFIPKLHILLEANLKHRNRRNKSERYHNDRKFNMDFVITRSDLLAPNKEMVDTLMPYLRSVLRQSLGRYGKLVTLGNVRCVSAHRGWWTKNLKDTIYKRGGAGWLVGKVNVGKSQLFEAVFPKGTTAGISLKNQTEMSMFAKDEDSEDVRYLTGDASEAEPLDENSLLPPARPETNYPEMPTVSSLPGTTASPIRIPFGNGRGELIDLPGIERSDLAEYVKPEHRRSLVLKHRITPEHETLTSGQSLLLGGGLIRITPVTDDLVFIFHNFTPLPKHRTATWKAIEYQNQTRHADNVVKFALDGVGEKTKLAGTFQLRHDVTKERAGPLTRKDVGKMKVEDLPFRVLATDILIEGVGWVEMVCQVRTRYLYDGVESRPEPEIETEEEALDGFAKLEAAAGLEEKPKAPPVKREPNWPVIEVYTPEGKFIAERPPMNGYLLNKKPKNKNIKQRPRKSMKGAKKAEKQAKRGPAAM